MKYFTIIIILLASFMTGCNTDSQTADEISYLLVTDGTIEKTYTISDLRDLPTTEALFNEIIYKGVLLKTILEDAQFDTTDLVAVKAVALDGFSANYDSTIFMRENVIVAYTTSNGTLTPDDGQFRMVLPGEAGRLNVRMLVTIQVIP